jgi:hypothetical protein
MRRMAPLLLFAAAADPGCTCTELPESRPAVAITAPFRDDFDRAELGPDWRDTSGADHAYKIENGELVARIGHNHPLWLTRTLPRNAVIELDCWSASDDGDLKVEAWGDGKSFATDLVGQYTSTSYNFIFGGWKNTTSTLARMHEHGGDRQTRAAPRVVKGQKYHWRIARSGGRVDWSIDGQPFLAYDDPAPLDGDGHRFFAFTDWEAELHFDHLVITPQ